MTRLAWLALAFLPLAACAPVKTETARTGAGYTGTVQKVFRVVRRGDDLPGMSFLGKAAGVLGPVLRRNAETHQYIVHTPGGRIIAQSDEEFSVGECVQVVPEADHSGPAFRYGEAAVVRSERCSG